MDQAEQLFTDYLNHIIHDEALSDAEAEQIVDDLRGNRTVLLFRSAEFYQGEEPDEGNAEFVLFCRSAVGIPVDCSDNLDELLAEMALMGVKVESHLYDCSTPFWAPLSWN